MDPVTSTRPSPLDRPLVEELLGLREEMVEFADSQADEVRLLDPGRQASARNLLHYLALRRRDLRDLQDRLAELGLSSLGRAESHVLATLDAVVTLVHQAQGLTWSPPQDPPPLDSAQGRALLASHTEALLGPEPSGRAVRIMVTMPSEAADDAGLVHRLLEGGMNVMRINCAHDGPKEWRRMIEHLRRAEDALRQPCRVQMDLGGPKLRTGPIEPGPAVLKVRPQRDPYGRVERAARVWICPEDRPSPPPTPADGVLLLPGEWVDRLEAGDLIEFEDARGARRELSVLDTTSTGAWALSDRTAYFVPGTVLTRTTRGQRETTLRAVPPTGQAIPLRKGDVLLLTRSAAPGRLATLDPHGQVLTPAMVGCTMPEVFEDVETGEAVWFDDGRIGGVVERKESDRLVVRITQTRARGGKLRADKGINLPDSQLRLSAMSEKDEEDLAFVATHADIVALSFVNSATDVQRLHERLDRLGAGLGVVLKVETRRGFENLPSMLLRALRSRACGVMIARGDLAVECGFNRLAEVQEEVLWLSEAAHVPVVWATQVLENLAKEGLASRAEITDAAMGHRAECVMLNKGPYVEEAVRALDDILRRMHGHQSKKRSMLRRLSLASDFART